MHVETKMNNAYAQCKLNQLPNSYHAPRNLYEIQTTMQALSIKTQNSKWHGNNAIMGDDKCLRQDLYL